MAPANLGNPYAYVLNNPWSLVDPFGYCGEKSPWEKAWEAIKGFGAGIDDLAESAIQGIADITVTGELPDPVGAAMDRWEANLLNHAASRQMSMAELDRASTLFAVDAAAGLVPGAHSFADAGEAKTWYDWGRSVGRGSGEVVLTAATIEAGFGRGRGVRAPVSGRATITATVSPRITVQSAHGARHLAGTGLGSEAVESAIAGQVRQAVSGATSTGSFWGRVTVGGRVVEYRAFTLPDGTINIGTYYPVNP